MLIPLLKFGISQILLLTQCELSVPCVWCVFVCVHAPACACTHVCVCVCVCNVDISCLASCDLNCL